jgi:hypothetical protein
MNGYFPRLNMEIVVLTNLGTAKPEQIAKDVAVALRRLQR